MKRLQVVLIRFIGQSRKVITDIIFIFSRMENCNLFYICLVNIKQIFRSG